MSAEVESAKSPGSGPSAAEQAALHSAKTSPYGLKEKIGRVLWNYLGQTLFRLTFHNSYGIRRALLRLFGASIGPHTRVRGSVRVEQPWNLTIGEGAAVGDRAILYCLGPVTIGDHVTISQGAHVCAGSHDYRDPRMPLIRPTIVIGDRAWIAADAFVGPGIVVGEGALLSARGCAMRDLDPWTIYAGNPAERLKARARAGEGAPDAGSGAPRDA